MPDANIFQTTTNFIHTHVTYLNSSKFFAGIVMILLNVGSKFIPIQFSRSTEEYLKMNVTKQLLVFAMAWMGTRDIYASLVLVAVFTVLSDHLFNEESGYCIVPEKYKVLNKLMDTNDDGIVSEEEKTLIGGIRFVYYIILSTHIFLATIILPFILYTAYRALTAEFALHKKIAKITWPLWLYVAITGPIVYWMIKPYYL
jgi:hypothetical protein